MSRTSWVSLHVSTCPNPYAPLKSIDVAECGLAGGETPGEFGCGEPKRKKEFSTDIVRGFK